MQMKRSNDPSTPESQGATNVSVIDILALDWMSIGALHYLIVVEKVTTYFGAGVLATKQLPIASR